MDSLKEKKERWWEYELETTSGRFVSNDVLAAIGREQLKKLPSFIARRKQVWSWYQRELANIPSLVLPPEPLPGCTSTYYLYWLQAGKRRDELASYLAANGVYNTFRYYPLHLVRHYNSPARLPQAEKANEITLNIPLHQNLSDGDIEQICGLVKKFYA
jgi:aminotransferase